MDVILDVDTGVDDALAILLAFRSPALRVLGITCVAGNVGVDQVVSNTLKVLDAINAPEAPVARGLSTPLVEPPNPATRVHGAGGLGNTDLPESSRRTLDVHAVEYLHKTLRDAQDPVTLIPLGPLTNIAVLLTQHPEVGENIREIVLMGGSVSYGGNATATAEFNIRHDPEAADIVFRAGLPTVMYGLDVFRQVTFTRPEAETFAAAGDPAARLAGQLLLYMMDNFGREDASVGDAGAVASVVQPEGLTTELRPVRVELAGQWTRGQTVVDRRHPSIAGRNSHWQQAIEPNVRVATDIDRDAYRQLFREAMLSGSAASSTT